MIIRFQELKWYEKVLAGNVKQLTDKWTVDGFIYITTMEIKFALFSKSKDVNAILPKGVHRVSITKDSK